MNISKKRARSRNLRKSHNSKTRVNKRRQTKKVLKKSKRSKRIKRRPTKRRRKVMKGGENDWRHDCYKNCANISFGDIENVTDDEPNECDTTCKYPRDFVYDEN